MGTARGILPLPPRRAKERRGTPPPPARPRERAPGAPLPRRGGERGRGRPPVPGRGADSAGPERDEPAHSPPRSGGDAARLPLPPVERRVGLPEGAQRRSRSQGERVHHPRP